MAIRAGELNLPAVTAQAKGALRPLARRQPAVFDCATKRVEILA